MAQELTRKTIYRGWISAVTVVMLIAGALAADGQTVANKSMELWLGGSPNAPVKLEVYSDYQCPICRAFYLETLKPLLATYVKENKIDKIYVVYHDFPLEMHQFSRKAVRYALAAHRVGRESWLRVNDALYTEQAQWSQDGNIEAVLAKTLDPTELVRVKKMAADPSLEAAIDQEVLLGQNLAITSTPTFFVIRETGRQERVTGGVTYPVLKDYLDKLLK